MTTAANLLTNQQLLKELLPGIVANSIILRKVSLDMIAGNLPSIRLLDMTMLWTWDVSTPTWTSSSRRMMMIMMMMMMMMMRRRRRRK